MVNKKSELYDASLYVSTAVTLLEEITPLLKNLFSGKTEADKKKLITRLNGARQILDSVDSNLKSAISKLS